MLNNNLIPVVRVVFRSSNDRHLIVESPNLVDVATAFVNDSLDGLLGSFGAERERRPTIMLVDHVVGDTSSDTHVTIARTSMPR